MTCNGLVFQIINFVTLLCVYGFNLSPKPNYIFKEPNLKTFISKVQSSYFGYSINLRSNSVMVGAPRAQSTLEAQRKINESGAIYKCSFNSLNCDVFLFDGLRNTNSENNEYELNSELKDHQWFGASMDGNLLDDERFVVCAPRMMTTSPQYDDYYGYYYDDYLMHGLCYHTPNTSSIRNRSIQKLAPLRKRENQYISGGKELRYFYMYGEQGVSVHITENNEEILIGAPGIFEWKGTIIRNKYNKKHRQNEGQNEFDIAIPNPAHWGQSDDSYFGYAVASGYFQGSQLKKILYVASAPQANLQEGEVYIFDIVDHSGSTKVEKTIKKYHTFTSNQMGQYFGYALAADDFNGDGFYDLAICAPFYSKENSYDNGAVYIYQNLGESTPRKWSSNFRLQSVLLSDYESGGRFGSSISRLGDINLDGFNDIAIGAPYEDNGAVYIYLGAPNGIISKPSQKLVAPYNVNVAPFSPHMFGLALSKGADIDQNNYLDLAVGAPNADTVYVYKSYPVVQINGNVYPSKELRINETSLKFRVCWSLTSRILHQTGINIKIELDEQFQRLKFLDKNNQTEINTTATTTEQCREYHTVVQFSPAYVFKPMDIEMRYSVSDKVPNSDVFCSKCVATNPSDSKVSRSKVVFITDCVNHKCVADLKLSSEVFSPLPYVIGTTNNITMKYEIENFGETAYLPQINITIPEMASYMKTPSNCQADNKKLLCNVNTGIGLKKGAKAFLNVLLDTTNLEGTELFVNASVISTSDESNYNDNHAIDLIPLAEFSDVEISVKSNKTLLYLSDGVESLLYSYEIRNHGPTKLKHIDVVLSIPISYQDYSRKLQFDVIPVETISVKSEYKNQQSEIERSSSQSNTYVVLNHNNSESIPDDNINDGNVSNNDVNLESLVTDRTILLDCYNTTTNQCVQYKFSLNNFQVGNALILIQLQFSIDNKIDKNFTHNIDSLVIRPSIVLSRNDNEEGEKMHVVQSYAYTIIRKQGSMAIWIYIVSALAGLFTLIIMTYGLYRFGFFRRAKKEQLKILVRQSQIEVKHRVNEEVD